MEEEGETIDIVDVGDVQVDPSDMSHCHHSPISVHDCTESHSQNQLNTSKSYEDNTEATELTEGRTITITSDESTTTTHEIEMIEEAPGIDTDKNEVQTHIALSTNCLLCMASLTSQEEIHEINQESAESLVCLLSLKPLKSSDSSLTSLSYTEFFQKSKYCGMCSTFLSNIFKYLKSLMFLQEQLAISKAVLVELISENYSEWVKDLVCEEEHFQNENYSSDKNSELVTIPAEELQVYPALFNEQGDLINDESNSLKHEENTYSYEVEIVDQSGDEQTASGGTSNDPLDLHVRNVAAYPGQQEDNNTLTIILPDHHLQGSHVNEIANGMYWSSDTLGSTSAPTYQGMMQPNVMINATVHENPTIPINPHHIQSHHGAKSYICNVCHKNFSSSGVLRTHMVIHGDKKFSCAICSKSFFYEHNLRTHAKTHKPHLAFSNNEHQQNQRISSSVNHNYHQPYDQRIPKNSKSLSTRNGNIKNSNTDPSFQFPCPRCNKTFRTKYNLNNHLFLHDNSTNFKDSTSSSHEYSFTCGKCGRQYLSNENLQKHLVVCNIISDKVKYRHDGSGTQHHVIAMNNSNPNYGMLGHQDLSHSHHQQHLTNNSSSSSSTAKCHICDKVFYSENYVKIHMKTHGEEKPFRCGVCSKGFTLRHYLQVHLRVHTGEKPYTCKLCGRNFTQKSSLNTHMRRHESSFNYA